ncbi:MAG: hypothetical protein ACHQAY_05095 [Hyphomicrobiales bacterium]
MHSREFISVIRKVVRDAAISDTIRILEEPPGRRPSQELLDRAEWYRSLEPYHRMRISEVITEAVDCAIFGFLCVIDGVRVVENGPVKGDFELRYVKGGSTLLNSPDEEMLHDLYIER